MIPRAVARSQKSVGLQELLIYTETSDEGSIQNFERSPSIIIPVE